MNAALIVVDLQQDFCPGGALGIEGGDEVVEPANRLIHLFESQNRPIYFTRDWHPENHCSFKENGGMWPPHCVAGTPGAEFHPDLYQPAGAEVVSKAVSAEKDAYSGFEGADLDDRLKAKTVEAVVIAGLATDYCVKMTALDAHRLGYKTTVVSDAVRAVEAELGDGYRSVKLMQIRGVEFAESNRIIEEFQSK